MDDPFLKWGQEWKLKLFGPEKVEKKQEEQILQAKRREQMKCDYLKEHASLEKEFSEVELAEMKNYVNGIVSNEIQKTVRVRKNRHDRKRERKEKLMIEEN